MFLNRLSGVQALNCRDQVLDIRAGRTIFPLAVVADAVDFVVEPDRAALGHAGLAQWLVRIESERERDRSDGYVTYLGRPSYAVPQHPDAETAVVRGGALVEAVKVDGMLQRAVLDQGALRDVFVVARQAHGEAEVRLGVGVESLRAELDDVAEACLVLDAKGFASKGGGVGRTLLGPVSAPHSVILVRRAGRG